MKTIEKTAQESFDLAKLRQRLAVTKTSKMAAIMKIQTELYKSLHDFMYEKGTTQLAPVVMCPNHRPTSS